MILCTGNASWVFAKKSNGLTCLAQTKVGDFIGVGACELGFLDVELFEPG